MLHSPRLQLAHVSRPGRWPASLLHVQRAVWSRRLCAAQQPLSEAREEMGKGSKPQKGPKAEGKPQADAGGMQHYTSYLQVLATDVDHSGPSLMLFNDKEGRILFNAGEGLQRLFRESKTKMQKLETYLFTRVSTETMSGLPGMLLSSGSGVPVGDAGGLLEQQATCSLYGPTGTRAYCNAFSNYINQEQALSIHEFDAKASSQALIKGAFMSISPVTISPVGGKSKAAPAAGEEGQEPSAKRQRTESGAEAAANGAATNGGSGDVAMADGEGAAAAAGAGGAAGATAGSEVHWPGTGEEAEAQVEAVAYVCELAGVPGKFDPKKAIALGLKPGPMFGQLQRGLSVTTPEGQVIEPSMVMDSPSQAGPLVVVVDLPSTQHLAAVKRGGPLDKWLAAGSEAAASGRLCVLAHLSPARLARTPEYTAWMASLGPHVRHLVCALEGQPCTLRRATILQAKLNCLHPSLFPVLQPPNLGEGAEGELSALAAEPSAAAASTAAAAAAPSTEHSGAAAGAAGVAAGGPKVPHLMRGLSGLKLNLTPIKSQGVDETEVGARDVDVAQVQADFRASAKEAVAASATLQQAAAAVAARGAAAANGRAGEAAEAAAGGGPEAQPVPEALQGIGRDVAEVVFLGTASSQPSKYRNVTALYVDCFARGGLLLDCGEDTLGQLKRRYGAADTERRLCELRMVWLSHMHADHHGGLYRLLEYRARLMGREVTPLMVVGPWPLFNVLVSYQKVVPLPFFFLPNAHLVNGRGNPPLAVLQAYHQAVAALGLRAVKPFEVRHIAHACGVVLEGLSGWKVVFSGDTRPCPSTVEAAKGAELLIHEATFEDEMADDAARKKHSTTGEALGVAEQAGVYRCVLTHFSTRYPTLPKGNLAALPHVAVACDFMSINLADLPWLPRSTAALGALFKFEEEGWEAEEQQQQGVPGGAVPAAGK